MLGIWQKVTTIRGIREWASLHELFNFPEAPEAFASSCGCPETEKVGD